MKIFVVNAGSSSLKFQLINMDDRIVLAKGCCERIGIDGSFSYSTFDGRKIAYSTSLPNHSAAFKAVLGVLISGEYAVLKSMSEIDAVGHRVVNGGERFRSSVLVTEQVLDDFEEVIDFAPLHNPPAYALLKACCEIFVDTVPNVLVFDTTFHQTMPAQAYLFAVPFPYYEKYKLRRYGAHGTSHHYVNLRCAELLGKEPSELKMITCHLGNGSSITAINQGKCIDTSMGFTPLGGLMMGTRSGDLDPSVVTFLMKKENLSADEVENLLNRGSGIVGVTGLSSDLRDVLSAAAAGDRQAQICFDMLIYQIKKYIGAYTAAMNGLDALVFTAGIGENASLVRKAVCGNMEYLGIAIDNTRNQETVGGKEADISASSARVKTCVIPTNEEYMIAFETKTIVESLVSVR